MPKFEGSSDWSVTEKVHVVARVDLVRTEDGGRVQPLIGGTKYRPNHNFFSPENRVMCMGELTIPRDKYFLPGEAFVCEISLIVHSEIADAIQPGYRWRIQEGRLHAADAEVIEVKFREIQRP